jgi:alcohol dehydrogenase (cytochrome c)
LSLQFLRTALIVLPAALAGQVQTPARPAAAGAGTQEPVGQGQGGPGQGRGANFPQQQRQLAEPAVLVKGKGLYEATCAACHAIDLRGGQQGGPNLLRSQTVLLDKEGELIVPVVSYDPETGKRQWILYTVPMNPGDPGVDTWPSLDAARHGGAQPWVPGVYDPETRLYIFGTGNPTPAYTPAARGTGVGLFTCSLVAVNVDTGKMAWYYQTSPRDMHDWDSAQTPVLIDATINGRARKLVSTAARNGYFFTVDRMTGEYVASGKYSPAADWASGLDAHGRPILNPEKVATIPGAIVSSSATNWPPPAYSPDTGLFYVPESNSLSIRYLIDADPRGSMGLGGIQGGGGVSTGGSITAIDPRAAKIAWRHELPGGGGATGMLTTAGRLLFAGDGAGNLVAFDPADGKPLWRSRIGTVSNAPQTYMIDGKQHLLVAAGDMLYSFSLYGAK